MNRFSSAFKKTGFRMALVIAAAAALRICCIQWGLPDATRQKSLHPDEEICVITVLFKAPDGRHFETTKYGITTGTGYFIAGKAVMAFAKKAGLVELDAQGYPADTQMKRRILTILRLLTAAFSTGTVIICFLFGKEWKGEAAGVAAAVFAAFSPVSVINAHYVKSDCATAFFVMLALYMALLSRRRKEYILLAALAAGFATASKYMAAPVFLSIVAAIWLFFQTPNKSKAAWIFIAALFFIAGLFMLAPSAFIYPERVWQELNRFPLVASKSEIITGALANILYYPALFSRSNGVLVAAAYFFALIMAVIRRGEVEIMLLTLILTYGIIIITFSEMFLRYFVTLIPLLSLLLAAAVTGKARLVFRITCAAVLLAASIVHLYAMAGQHPLMNAREWTAANLPPYSAIAITMKFPDDFYFSVPLPDRAYTVYPLNMRKNIDVSEYLNGPFNYVAANELAWTKTAGKRHESHDAFWREINNPNQWRMIASFNNRRIKGLVFMQGKLPEDMYYIYQEIKIYERNRKKP